MWNIYQIVIKHFYSYWDWHFCLDDNISWPTTHTFFAKKLFRLCFFADISFWRTKFLANKYFCPTNVSAIPIQCVLLYLNKLSCHCLGIYLHFPASYLHFNRNLELNVFIQPNSYTIIKEIKFPHSSLKLPKIDIWSFDLRIAFVNSCELHFL